jgi:ubiquinone/menaquinone biosynthesis C-methylase UbiE
MTQTSSAGQANFSSSIAENYDRYLGASFFAPFASDLAERAATLSPSRVLEFAAGTGLLTYELAKQMPWASVLATDLSEPMLVLAEQRAAHLPNTRFRVADAQSTDLPTGAYDLVVHQFGVMFFPDRAAHYREARRLINSTHGHLLFSTYDTLESNDCPRIAEEALAALFPEQPLRFISRIPHGYSDPEIIERELNEAGFETVNFVTVEKRCIAPTARQIAQGLCLGTPIRMEIMKRDPDGMSRAIDAVEEALQAQLGRGGLEGRMQAHIVCAA